MTESPAITSFNSPSLEFTNINVGGFQQTPAQGEPPVSLAGAPGSTVSVITNSTLVDLENLR